MANLPQHINKPGAIDADSDLSVVQENRLRSGINVELIRDDKMGDLRRMRGTKPVLTLYDSGFANVGSVEAFGKINGVKTEGIVYFYRTDETNKIVFFDFTQVFTLYEGQFGWLTTTEIDTAFISEPGDNFYVYFTDSVLRRIKVQYPLTQTLDDLYVQPLDPIDPIEFSSIQSEGSLLSGSYQFFYRYYNISKCSYSNWSSVTPAIPIIPTTRGGRVGQNAGKKIRLNIPSTAGRRNFTHVQLAVIENTSELKTNPTTARLLYPKPFGTDLEYSGNEEGVIIDLADVLVDKLSVLYPKTIGSTQNRLFAGNFQTRDFKVTPVVEAARTIQRQVDYATELDCVKYKSCFRDELYVYGVRYVDEFGNSAVYPLDLKNFTPTTPYLTAVTTSTGLTSSKDGIAVLPIADPTKVQIGDVISRNGDILTVVDKTSTTIYVTGTITNNGGNVDILLGQRGNRGTSYAWKYPKRSDNQFTIFDEQGKLTALGIHLSVKGHPAWAKRMEIVRLKRKEDILYQMPHVPSITVQGKASGFGTTYEYKGANDHFAPKIHFMGHARNLYLGWQTGVTSPSLHLVSCAWEIQNDQDGPGEIPQLIFGQPPEYMYNVGGTSFDLKESAGANLEIVDAVSLIYRQKNISPYDYVGFLPGDPFQSNAGKLCHVFDALSRSRYLYNREGYVVYSNSKVYQPSIKTLLSLSDVPIDYQLEVAHNAPLLVLPGTFMNYSNFQPITQWGALNDLLKATNTVKAIPGRLLELWKPDAENQRGLVLKIKDKLEDFTYLMSSGKLIFGHDFFPLENWATNSNAFTQEYLNFTFAYGGSIGNVVRPVAYVPAGENGQSICGSYILNVKRGLGDDRYGDIKSISGSWVTTGAHHILTEAEIRNNTPIAFDVYGGDCFISRHSIKVNQHSAIPWVYDPVDSETGLGSDFGLGTSVTKLHLNAEILSLYLESTVNANFENFVDRYPDKDDGALGSYAGKFEYYYHPGYSKENIDKPLATYYEACRDARLLRHSACWSDPRIPGATSNPFNDIDGLNIWRVNNIWTLDGQYGDLMKIIALEDKALHLFQERKIAFQPIGVDELQTVDGALIATGTGQVLGSGDYYIQRELGTQHMLTVVQWDGMIYAYDDHRKMVYRTGSRGSGFEEIGEMGVRSILQKKSFRKAHIDPKNRRYVLHGDQGGLVYNILGKGWETELDTTKLNWGQGVGRKTYWTDIYGWISEAWADDQNLLFDEVFDSYASVVVNSYPNVTKVFQALKINATNGVHRVRCQTFNEELDQDTGWLDVHKANNQYYENLLRAKRDGRSEKLNGQFMVITAWMKNPTAVAAIVSSIRKRF